MLRRAVRVHVRLAGFAGFIALRIGRYDRPRHDGAYLCGTDHPGGDAADVHEWDVGEPGKHPWGLAAHANANGVVPAVACAVGEIHAGQVGYPRSVPFQPLFRRVLSLGRVLRRQLHKGCQNGSIRLVLRHAMVQKPKAGIEGHGEGQEHGRNGQERSDGQLPSIAVPSSPLGVREDRLQRMKKVHS
jgi:hypothetical protein